MTGDASRRWGAETALLDDDEARRRLVDATRRCLIRRGSARITVQEVAKEAAVARSTVYRYFANRDELLLGVLLAGIDTAISAIVVSLPHPEDASHSLVELVMRPLELVKDNQLTDAMFADDGGWVVMALEVSSEAVVETYHRHLGPLIEQWLADGQLHADLDPLETTRWINAVALLLMASPWVSRTDEEKRLFVKQYLVRALVHE
jgi:AcrR family transcriptional regulator